MLRQGVVDLVVAGNGLALAGRWIQVEVVAGVVAGEDAAGALQLADQIAALHMAISLS